MAYTIDRYPCGDSPRLGAMTLCPEPESVPRARRWFRKFIAPYDPACSVDDCALMISELVTNAIRYGKSDEPWLVRVEWYREGASLRVDVHNPGFPANVRLRHPEADDAHGRGLLLVDSLADSWRSGPSCFGGTVVSFVVADAWPA
ncbi:ATP-binding protein [Streptomyces somaliensis]|uniref:ATP-binding protein n=1 Tax=Streptomyces somaliensis TaxID=78355 RepID=UPI0020CFA8C6|nr:ATP-binding protein [Streptomyces somaliensis]MCP9945598.1 ATP-binding protein [Streptomyces somaliensis]MCP9961218.1 ATP-binding protein [Streptomyces somaliensis]MCP9974017.1 ATP-binding protein [Streptomyces somaliensis]